MIFLELFFTFLKIGLFTFGGGAAMVALIQNEVTIGHSWLTTQEFTDILAVSQMTPGPIGINTATYTGYTAVVNAGYDPWLGIVGSLLASLAVIMLPMALMIVTVRFLRKYKNNKYVFAVMRLLRIVVIGIIAAAALQLATKESFGEPGISVRFISSMAIFGLVLTLALKKKSPVYLMLGAGATGILLGLLGVM